MEKSKQKIKLGDTGSQESWIANNANGDNMICYLVLKAYPELHDHSKSFEPIAVCRHRSQALKMKDKAEEQLRSRPVEHKFWSDDDYMDAVDAWEKEFPHLDCDIDHLIVQKVPMHTTFVAGEK